MYFWSLHMVFCLSSLGKLGTDITSYGNGEREAYRDKEINNLNCLLIIK